MLDASGPLLLKQPLLGITLLMLNAGLAVVLFMHLPLVKNRICREPISPPHHRFRRRTHHGTSRAHTTMIIIPLQVSQPLHIL